MHFIIFLDNKNTLTGPLISLVGGLKAQCSNDMFNPSGLSQWGFQLNFVLWAYINMCVKFGKYLTGVYWEIVTFNFLFKPEREALGRRQSASAKGLHPDSNNSFLNFYIIKNTVWDDNL